VSLVGGYLRATVRANEQGEKREARIKQYLQEWYRPRALEHLSTKARRYSEQIGVSPAGISVRDFTARWGSCHKNGSLVFNWNIIKAPHSIVDYVVIHELCHLLYPNHSKDFWRLVRRYDELHGDHREWLKTRGLLLLPASAAHK
jgi:predicted metal-dependent hydrolase